MKRRKIDDPPEKDDETLDMFAPDIPGARRERDRVLATLESTRKTVLEQLRNHAAAIYRATGRPVSTNDIRADLREMGYTGDGRILGAVFKKPWRIVGQTTNDMKHNHAGLIRLFVLDE